MADNLFTVSDAQLRVCVDANMGAHIVEFSLAGENALASARPEIGSTFWPSPQQSWGWPPPLTLDKAPYSATQHAHRIELTSAICERTGLRVKKVFSLESGRMVATYTMLNTLSEPVAFAPWEVTRTYGGLTFFESAEPPLAISTGVAGLNHGCVWHDYRPEMQEHHEKVYGNGSSGWLANVCGGLLLLKEFTPVEVSALAPGEAEVEIYSHGDPQAPYIEMEQQGRYQSLEPDEELSWEVVWQLHRVPQGVESTAGSPELVAWVKSLLQGE